MRILAAIFLLFTFALGASAQATNRITAIVTVTNGTADNFAFSLNGNTRVFTNTVTAAASQIATNETVSGTASNLYYHIIATPFSGPVVPLSFTNGSNVIFLRGALGQAMSVTILSNWATVEYSTQVFSSGLIDVRVPIASESSGVRVKVASELVTGINAYTTNAFATNSPALTNHLSLGPQPQRASNKVFEASHITGSAVSNSTLVNITSGNIGTLIATNATIRNGSATNLFVTNSPSVLTTNLNVTGSARLTNVIIHTLTATNFSAPGTAPGSTLIGSANDSTNATAVGVGQEVTSSTAASVFGAGGSINESPGFVGVGHSLIGAQATNSIAIGKDVEITSPHAIVIGPAGVDAGPFTTTYGFQNDSSTNYFFGNSVWTDGYFIFDTTVSNTTIRGVSTVNSRLDFTPRANSALADGNNSGIVLGTNVYVRLSGPSGAYTNAGFVAEQDGSFHILQFDNPVNNMTILDNSGLDATSANRIRTSTGGNLNFTNNPVILRVIYDGAASRWRLLDGAPYR